MAKKTTEKSPLQDFNPNDVAAAGNNIFGLPFNTENAKLVLLPVPWEVTVSYKGGTAKGPEAIFEASMQVDLYDPIAPNIWQKGIAMMEINTKVAKQSKQLRSDVEKYIDGLQHGKTNEATAKKVNQACEAMIDFVEEETSVLLNEKKLVGLIGGDHSTPLGFIKALAKKHKEFGVLQIDAHCDLREAYEGFKYSHASIMFNVLKEVSAVKKLVQVGIRDYCEEEMDLIKSSKKVKTFFDKDLKQMQFGGESWKKICDKIAKELPQNVYISFDIDGLYPKLCPHTGTPVPGGLEFEQAVYLMENILTAGKKIIGFDLNEVAPGKDEWDANVGARMLFKMCHLMLKSNTK
jgi:agmatinase